MSGPAKVTSIESILTLAAAIESFAKEVSLALEYLDQQIQKADEWLARDRQDYWKREVTLGFNRVAQARADLERCQTRPMVGNHRPSCIDEKKAMQRSQRRLRIAQDKVRTVGRWRQLLERQEAEVISAKYQLGDWVRTELPRAMAALKRMGLSLDSYVALVGTSEISDRRIETSLTFPGVIHPKESFSEGGVSVDALEKQVKSPSNKENPSDENVGSNNASGSVEAGPQGSPEGDR